MKLDEPLIRMEGVSKLYRMGDVDVPALRRVDLTVEAGEHLALVGRSGSGKSTLMHLLGCLDRPTEGTYYLEGRDVSRLDSDERARIRREKIGFVFQNFNLLPRTSALENVELPLLYGSRLPDRERTRLAMESLERVGLKDRVHHHPSQLSGGQQQRVAIARALVHRPQILLADEPTGNVDSRSGESILSLLHELNEEGMTLILVTHDFSVAERARRTVTLQDGEIVAETVQGAGV
jgi:putative ABC transport system ATP-binding protein